MSEEPRAPDPSRFDPWSGNRYGGLRWFTVSAVIHVGLLVLFATITLTVLRKNEEVRVSIVDGTDIAEAADSSLNELAGVLKMEKTLPERAAPKGPTIRNPRAPVLPRPDLGAVGPKLGTNPDLPPVASGAVAFGGGAVGSLGGSFGSYVGGLRKAGLDVVLVIDATSSMQFVLDDVRESLNQFVATLQRLVPAARVGIVVYRDQGDDFVTKWTDLSFHTKKLSDFLATITAAGGGDFEEAVREAFEVAMQDLSWRKKSKRVLVLVGGSPPHAWEVDAVHQLAGDFADDRSRVHAIDVTKQAHYRHDLAMWRAIHGKEEYKASPLPDYMKDTAASLAAIAKAGGGEMLELGQDEALLRDVLQLTFGSRWKKEMAKFLEEIQ